MELKDYVFKIDMDFQIRCTASMHSVYWKSTEKSIEEDRPRSHKNRNKDFQLTQQAIGAENSLGRGNSLHSGSSSRSEDELADQDHPYNAQPKSE